MTSRTKQTEAEKLAQDIVDHDRWFRDLDPRFKDDLSEPNHEAVTANMGRKLARLVLGGKCPTGCPLHPCPLCCPQSTCPDV